MTASAWPARGFRVGCLRRTVTCVLEEWLFLTEPGLQADSFLFLGGCGASNATGRGFWRDGGVAIRGVAAVPEPPPARTSLSGRSPACEAPPALRSGSPAVTKLGLPDLAK